MGSGIHLYARLIRPFLAGALALAPAAAMGQTSRTLTLTNECPYTVYPGATAGSANADCVNKQCASGQTCNPDNNKCYWNQPTSNGAPLDGYHVRLASKQSVQVSIPIPSQQKNAIVWSGGIWAGTDAVGAPARTDAKYTYADAASGYCAASAAGTFQIKACPAYTGPQAAPYTQAEFTLVNSFQGGGTVIVAPDFYDITAINGVNVPMSMGPTPNQQFGPNPNASGENAQYYWCKTPGSVPGDKGQDAQCNWSFARLNNGVGMTLVQHQQQPKLCGGPGQTCPSGQTCGISYDPSSGVNGLRQECGTTGASGAWSGTWTTVQICTAINYDWTPYQTNGQVSHQLIANVPCGTSGPAGTNAQLLQCTGQNSTSCFSSNAGASCCGCPAWSAYKSSEKCISTNSHWHETAGAWLAYVKSACPSAYTFQFDDPTATFTCSTDVASKPINTANYTITFCPSGKVAAPGTIASP